MAHGLDSESKEEEIPDERAYLRLRTLGKKEKGAVEVGR